MLALYPGLRGTGTAHVTVSEASHWKERMKHQIEWVETRESEWGRGDAIDEGHAVDSRWTLRNRS